VRCEQPRPAQRFEMIEPRKPARWRKSLRRDETIRQAYLPVIATACAALLSLNSEQTCSWDLSDAPQFRVCGLIPNAVDNYRCLILHLQQ
jgi:hypothetical protein